MEVWARILAGGASRCCPAHGAVDDPYHVTPGGLASIAPSLVKMLMNRPAIPWAHMIIPLSFLARNWEGRPVSGQGTPYHQPPPSPWMGWTLCPVPRGVHIRPTDSGHPCGYLPILFIILIPGQIFLESHNDEHRNQPGASRPFVAGDRVGSGQDHSMPEAKSSGCEAGSVR